jgi:hypothetical protein
MKVVIIGFNDYEKLDNAMQSLIAEKQCYLFTVLCGGTSPKAPQTMGTAWAEKNGAPLEYIFDEDVEKLLEKISKSADYIVAFVDGSNNMVNRLIMKMKNLGKHGTVIK